MLRSSIRKPEVFDSDDPILSYGFLNLINLFEKLTVDLYDWISTGSEDGLSGVTLTGSIQGNLCSPISLDGVLETQQVDILITQQWLQAVMWRLAVSRSLQKSSGNDALLPFHFPVTVGKSALGVLSSVSQSSIDAHGIGMVRPPRPHAIENLVYLSFSRNKNSSTSAPASETSPDPSAPQPSSESQT